MSVDTLLALAAQQSANSRAAVAQATIDLFLNEDARLAQRQRAQMNDVLTKLIGSVEIELRQYAVEGLITADPAAVEVQALLADDRIELAFPVLARTMMLRKEELVDAVMRRAEEHRMAVALRREGIPPFRDMDNPDSHDLFELLIRNNDAMLSRRAMEVLLAESRRYDRFQEPMLARADLSAELAAQMFWWVSAALRIHVLERFEIDTGLLDRVLEGAARRGIEAHSPAEQIENRALRLAIRLDELGDLTDIFLRSSLRQSQITLFTAALAVRGGIGFSTAWSIVADRNGESLVLLLRALDMDRAVAADILSLLDQMHEPLAASSAPRLGERMLRFDATADAHARRVLDYWRLDPDYRIAVSTLESERA